MLQQTNQSSSLKKIVLLGLLCFLLVPILSFAGDGGGAIHPPPPDSPDGNYSILPDSTTNSGSATANEFSFVEYLITMFEIVVIK